MLDITYKNGEIGGWFIIVLPTLIMKQGGIKHSQMGGLLLCYQHYIYIYIYLNMYNVYRCIDHTVLHMLYFIVLNMTLQKLHYIVIYIYTVYIPSGYLLQFAMERSTHF